MKILKKLLLMTLPLCLIAAVCLAACGREDIDYAVTVVCEQAEALENVQVTLKAEDGSAVENGGPKALTDGSAAFTLPAATYKVALSGVPENFLWDPAWVSEEKPNATVTLVPRTEETEYAVTALDKAGSPVAGVRLSLMDGAGNKAGSKETDGSGKASFSAPPATYTLSVDYMPEGYYTATNTYTMSADAPTQTLSFTKLSPADEIGEKLRGDWKDLGGTLTLSLEADALYFNDEALTAYAYEDGLVFWAGSTVYMLAPPSLPLDVLTLTQGQRELLLTREAGLARLTTPAELVGTWTPAEGETALSFRANGFTYAGREAYIVYIPTEKEANGALRYYALYEDGTKEPASPGYFTFDYFEDTREVFMPGCEAAFRKTGTGTANDPGVLERLAGDYSYTLSALLDQSESGVGFNQSWMYEEYYLIYTAGKTDETYTLVVTDNELVLRMGTGLDADGEFAEVLANWDANSATTNYVPLTLTAGCQYTIVLSNARRSAKELPPYTATFTIKEGAAAAPAPRTIDENFFGIWYNVKDENDRLVISHGSYPWEDDTAVWNGKVMGSPSCAGGTLTAALDGKTWTFTRDEAALTGVCGGETASFSLLSKNPHSEPIPAAYGGLWICSAEISPSHKTEYLYIVPYSYTGVYPEIEITDNGAFYWMGRAAIVTDASLFGLTIVMDDLVWEGLYDNSGTLTVRHEDTAYSFSKSSQYVNDFTPFMGEWKDASGELPVSIKKDTFIFNGTLLAGSDGSVDEDGSLIEVASKIVSDGSGNRLLFCVEGRFYTLEKSDAGLLLTCLNAPDGTPSAIALSKA